MTSHSFGRYEIRGELGRGGMAIVYHAYDPRFNRDVALKILPREFLFSETFRARFAREAQAIAGLEHSAIVPVHDFGEEQDQPYFVMRYMAGGSLADRIQSRPIPLADIASIMERIAAALDWAHNKGVIHRDVKPANILFDQAGDPFLSDFGIVKLTEATTHLTGSGIVGTPAYMAPEMTGKAGTSPLIDIYAMGVMVFQAVTGHLPYNSDTPMGLMMAHVTQPIPDVRAHFPDLPDEIQTVIEKAMAKDPAERYQTASALAADLREAAMTGGTSVPPSPQETPETVAVSPFAPPPDLADLEAAETVPYDVVLVSESFADTPQQSTRPSSSSDIRLAASGRPSEAHMPPARPDPVVSAPRTRSRRRIRFGLGIVAVGIVSCVMALLMVFKMRSSQDPAWSPDSTRIAFSSDRHGDFEIYTINRDGTNLRQLTHNSFRDQQPTWLPDGNRILFHCDWELCVVNADGTGLTTLQDTWRNAGFDLSPDGSKIAFALSTRGEFIINTDGTDLMQIVPEEEIDGQYFLERPIWSPDGTRIAYAAGREGARSDIYIVDADGTDPIQITSDPAADWPLAWFSDGQRLLIGSGPDYPVNGYVVTDDGTNLLQLTEYSEYEYGDDFILSPDGEWLAYSSVDEQQIFAIRSDGSDKKTISDDHQVFRRLMGWSPDSSQLAYWETYVDEQVLYQIITVNVDDGTRTSVTPEPGHYGFDGWSSPWSPDGKWLVYSYSRSFNIKRFGSIQSREIAVASTDGTSAQQLTYSSIMSRLLSWLP